MSIDVQVRLLDERYKKGIWELPTYGTNGSAALDLRAAISDPIVIPAGGCELIDTGISVYVKDPEYAAVILPRSGLGHKKGLVLGNGTGLIDSDYQGPLMVSAFNRNPAPFPIPSLNALAKEPVVISPGDRIAQLMFIPVARANLLVVDTFDEGTERGEGGFGSTGVTGNASSS